jgi:hypothetical protein
MREFFNRVITKRFNWVSGSDDTRLVSNSGLVFIRVKVACLTLKLVAIRPVVVAFEKGDITSPRSLDRTPQIPLDAQVVGRAQNSNSVI